MNTAIVIIAATVIASGSSTFYNPGRIEAAIENHISYGHIRRADLKNVKGYVALMNPEDIGRFVWLQRGERIDGPYLVVDCAAAHHRETLRRDGWAVDLSWEVAKDWDVNRAPAGGFIVWDGNPTAEPDGPRPM